MILIKVYALRVHVVPKAMEGVLRGVVDFEVHAAPAMATRGEAFPALENMLL